MDFLHLGLSYHLCFSATYLDFTAPYRILLKNDFKTVLEDSPNRATSNIFNKTYGAYTFKRRGPAGISTEFLANPLYLRLHELATIARVIP